MEFENYQKYKWFFTASGKLVVGGKSSSQNDELLNAIKKEKKNFLVMHTASPGSPFSVILSNMAELTKSDKEEAATFTGCFSQAWKSSSKKIKVHSFLSNDVYKSNIMKSGTWGVRNVNEEFSVEKVLVLTRQNGILRSVPFKTVDKKNILLKVTPGNLKKEDLLPKISVMLDDSVTKSEILAALPAGGLKIEKW